MAKRNDTLDYFGPDEEALKEAELVQARKLLRLWLKLGPTGTEVADRTREFFEKWK